MQLIQNWRQTTFRNLFQLTEMFWGAASFLSGFQPNRLLLHLPIHYNLTYTKNNKINNIGRNLLYPKPTTSPPALNGLSNQKQELKYLGSPHDCNAAYWENFILFINVINHTNKLTYHNSFRSGQVPFANASANPIAPSSSISKAENLKAN